MSIDLTKPVRTRDGRSVRLLVTDLKSPYPVVGIITEKLGNEIPCSWTLNGRQYTTGESVHDLENIPDEKREWAYVSTSGYVSDFRHVDKQALTDAVPPSCRAGLLEFVRVDGVIKEINYHAN